MLGSFDHESAADRLGMFPTHKSAYATDVQCAELWPRLIKSQGVRHLAHDRELISRSAWEDKSTSDLVNSTPGLGSATVPHFPAIEIPAAITHPPSVYHFRNVGPELLDLGKLFSFQQDKFGVVKSILLLIQVCVAHPVTSPFSRKTLPAEQSANRGN